MIWQDIVFAVGGVCFALALLPSVLTGNKPDLRTSSITAFWLWIFAACYWTLHLPFAAVTTACSASLWTTLWVQVVRR